MSQGTINLVASGCGVHCRRSHLQPALSTGRFKLVAAYDPSPASLAAAAEFAPGMFTYAEDFTDVLQHPGAYAAVICGPDDTHLLQMRAALEAGLHVLVDKPVATTRADLREIQGVLELAARRKLVLATCLPRRTESNRLPYGWVFHTLPELAAELGELLYISLDFSYHELDVEGTWREGRSLLLDHFAHEGDLVHKMASVYRGQEQLPFRARREVDAPEEYLVTGMVGGLPFMCHGSRYEPGKNTFAERIQLRFRRGVCTVDTLTGEAELYWFGTGRREFIHVDPVNGPDGHNLRFGRMMELFADAIEAGVAGHAYLTPAEFLLSVEAPVMLNTSGTYTRR